MRHYDFIEIGTSDFDSIIGHCSDDAVGISIEPISWYLDSLPNPPKVAKVNEAISNVPGLCEIRYVPRDKVELYGLPLWLRGCAQIDSTHPIIEQYIACGKLPAEEVMVRTVRKTTLLDIYDRFRVASVDLLKIDAEGHDTVILDGFIEQFMETQRRKKRLPKRIFFESNSLTTPQALAKTVGLYEAVGYEVESTGYNTTLVR